MSFCVAGLIGAEVAVRMGKKYKNVFFLTCYKMCSCRFAWQAWHFVTFHVCAVREYREGEIAVLLGKVAQTCPFRLVTRCAHVAFNFTVYTPLSTTPSKLAIYSRHSILYTPHSTLHTLHLTLHIPHSPLSTPHCAPHTLHTLHSALYTPLFTLHTSHPTLHILHIFHSTL